MTKHDTLTKVKQYLHEEMVCALMDLTHMLEGNSIPEHSEFSEEVIKRLAVLDKAKSLWETADYALEHIDVK